MSMKEEIIFHNGIAYVSKTDFDDIWNLYTMEIKEKNSLQDKLEVIEKENSRLKRLERRQKSRWERNNK